MEQASPGTVQLKFTLGFGDAHLNASVEVPGNGTTTVTELLPILQNLTNNIVNAVVTQVEAGGRQISCRAGCGACCRQLVPISLFEAEALGAWISSLEAEEQEALERRFHEALLGLRDSGILERMTLEFWKEGRQETRQLVLDYFAARVPCPFLVEESCSIHPIRPLVCREYLVTSPPEFCAEPGIAQVDGVRMPVKLSKALYRLGEKIENSSTGWIPLVFLMHWRKSGAEPGRQMAGPAPRVIYEVISQLQALSKERAG